MNESFSFSPLYIGLFLSLSLCVCVGVTAFPRREICCTNQTIWCQ